MTQQLKEKHSTRGFASLTPEKMREIASKGGKAAHAKGTAHKFTSEEAKIAGRKGGLARSGETLTEEQRFLQRKLARMGGRV
jgi:general stress protein YciG